MLQHRGSIGRTCVLVCSLASCGRTSAQAPAEATERSAATQAVACLLGNASLEVEPLAHRLVEEPMILERCGVEEALQLAPLERDAGELCRLLDAARTPVAGPSTPPSCSRALGDLPRAGEPPVPEGWRGVGLGDPEVLSLSGDGVFGLWRLQKEVFLAHRTGATPWQTVMGKQLTMAEWGTTGAWGITSEASALTAHQNNSWNVSSGSFAPLEPVQLLHREEHRAIVLSDPKARRLFVNWPGAPRVVALGLRPHASLALTDSGELLGAQLDTTSEPNQVTIAQLLSTQEAPTMSYVSLEGPRSGQRGQWCSSGDAHWLLLEGTTIVRSAETGWVIVHEQESGWERPALACSGEDLWVAGKGNEEAFLSLLHCSGATCRSRPPVGPLDLKRWGLVATEKAATILVEKQDELFVLEVSANGRRIRGPYAASPNARIPIWRVDGSYISLPKNK